MRPRARQQSQPRRTARRTAHVLLTCRIECAARNDFGALLLAVGLGPPLGRALIALLVFCYRGYLCPMGRRERLLLDLGAVKGEIRGLLAHPCGNLRQLACGQGLAIPADDGPPYKVTRAFGRGNP